jgi:PKD repeat protein
LFDEFGWSVALDGSTTLVGAVRDDNANGDIAGAAYAFELDADSDPGRPAPGGEAPPPVGEGSAPPTDPDGDGVYEDVNGDGRLSILDVADLLESYDDSTVQANADAFDFTGEGSLSILDVAELLERV